MSGPLLGDGAARKNFCCSSVSIRRPNKHLFLPVKMSQSQTVPSDEKTEQGDISQKVVNVVDPLHTSQSEGPKDKNRKTGLFFVVSNANWTYKGRYVCMEILWRPDFLIMSFFLWLWWWWL